MRVLIPSVLLLAACAESALTPPVQGGVDSDPERGLTVVGVAPAVQLDAPVAVAENPDIDVPAREDVVESWEDVPGTPIAIAVVLDVGYRAQADEALLQHAALGVLRAASEAPHPQDTVTLIAHTDRVASRLTPALTVASGALDSLEGVAEGLQSCSTLRAPESWSDLGYHSFAPHMPPCWGDERGADLAAPLALAAEALDEAPDDAVKAVLIVGSGRVRALTEPGLRPADLQLYWRSHVAHEGEASVATLRAAALDEAAALADDGVVVWSVGLGDADGALLRGLSSSGGAVDTRSPARIDAWVHDAFSGLRAAAAR